MIQPIALGAPQHLADWRPQQAEAFEWLLSTTRQYAGANLPVGVGKSLLAWAYPRILGQRALILTDTKGLMDQYETEFQPVGLRDIRGMGNYPCRALGNRERCDAGPCLDGEECIWLEAGCSYFDRRKAATDAPIALSNYAYWFSHPEPDALGPRDILVCDEAHALPQAIAQAAGATFHAGEVRFDADAETWDITRWRDWGRNKLQETWEVLRESAALSYGERRDLRSLALRFGKLAYSSDAWAFEWSQGPLREIRFEPVLAAAHAQRLLFRGIPKVLLLSGTMRRDTFGELGIGQDAYDYLETESPFPVARRPIYWLETGVRVTAKCSETKLAWWAGKIDQVIAGRLPYKGIIHTVSYSRAKFLRERSRFAKHMLLHTSSNTREIVERYRAMPAPVILLSPSVDTGWNFPYDQARWQIIAKVPFPDTRFGIAAARKEAIQHYTVKVAIDKLQQMAGRVMRAQDDWGETIIVDDSMQWLYTHYRPWFNRWWREAFRPVAVVPPPPVL